MSDKSIKPLSTSDNSLNPKLDYFNSPKFSNTDETGFIIRGCYTKNFDPDNYSYFGYCFSFDVHGTFSLTNGRFGTNVVIFGADMSSSVLVDNKKGYINSW